MQSPLAADTPEIPWPALRAEDVEPTVRAAIAEAAARVAAIGPDAAAHGPTWARTLGALDQATRRLDEVSNIVHHIENVATSPEWRAAYNAVQADIAAFSAEIPLNDALWAAIQAFAATPEAVALDPERARLLSRTQADFRKHGADLPPEGKAELMALTRALAEKTSKFAQNVLDATNAWTLHLPPGDLHRLTGLPESALEQARVAATQRGLEGAVLTLQMPCYLAVLTYADDASLREMLYRAYAGRAVEGPWSNAALVVEILALRRAQATLLGFKDFADFVTSDRMAGSGARAAGFVSDLQRRARPAFEAEAAALQAYRCELEGEAAPPCQPWDLAYYAEKLQKARYALDDEALRPYLPLDRVLSGLFALLERLYGVRVEPRPDLPRWHDDAPGYALRDADGALLGLFHTDLHPRASKRGGAWMVPLRTALPTEGAPHVGLVCGNMTPPGADGRACLRFSEAETLFHEFGHLLHHLLSRVSVRGLAGTNVAWDFVELPSQIHENFLYTREVLDLCTGHVETGAPLPEALVEALIRARAFRQGTATMRQLAFAEMDLALHRDYDPSVHGDVLAFARGYLQRASPAPLPEGANTVASFTHLFAGPVAYASGYYSYKWAEVLEADAFETLAPGQRVSPEAGQRFRALVLSRGDAEAPAALFEAFVGRAPSLDALLRRAGLTAAA